MHPSAPVPGTRPRARPRGPSPGAAPLTNITVLTSLGALTVSSLVADEHCRPPNPHYRGGTSSPNHAESVLKRVAPRASSERGRNGTRSRLRATFAPKIHPRPDKLSATSESLLNCSEEPFGQAKAT